MTKPLLTSERITQLALELSMHSSQRSIGLADGWFKQIEGALRWHRDSCRPLQLSRRLMQALATRRLISCIALFKQQKALLSMAANDGSDDDAVLDALIALADAWAQYELGPNVAAKERLALASCRTSAKRARFAQLVRYGAITTTHGHLVLQHETRRRISAYATLAMFAAWPSFIFCCMAADGALEPWELSAHLGGATAIAAWLTRGLFDEIRSDLQAVQDANALLSPRAVDTAADAFK